MSDTTNTFDNLDISIRVKIREGRERFDACTMRWVAMQLNVSPDVVRHRLQKMANDGLVTWNDMPGSLVAADEVAVVAEDTGAEVAAEVLALDVAALPVLAAAAPPAAKSVKKPAAAKKSAAAKKPAKKQAASKPRR